MLKHTKSRKGKKPASINQKNKSFEKLILTHSVQCKTIHALSRKAEFPSAKALNRSGQSQEERAFVVLKLCSGVPFLGSL